MASPKKCFCYEEGHPVVQLGEDHFVVPKGSTKSALWDGPHWLKAVGLAYIAVVGGLASIRLQPVQAPGGIAVGKPLVAVARALALGLGIPYAALFTAAGFAFVVNWFSKDKSQKFAGLVIPCTCGVMNWKFRDVRREFLKSIKGRVLDVGCGAGPYLEYYVESRKSGGGVEEAVMLEPNPYMKSKLEASAARAMATDPGLKVDVQCGFIESLKGEALFDSVVFGNVLCEVPNQEAFLTEVGRLLKPGGRIFFSEHVGVKPKASLRRRFQEMINPFWVVFLDGCNVNRDTIDVIESQPWVKEIHTWGWDVESPACRLEIGIATKH